MKNIIKIFAVAIMAVSCTTINLDENLVLDKIQTKNEVKKVLDKNVTLIFSKNKISGSGFVNIYSGEYIAKGNNFKVDKISTTRMAGTKENMDLEYEYFDKLSKLNKIKRDSNNAFIIYTKKTDDKLIYINKTTENDINKRNFELLNNRKITLSFDNGNIYGKSLINSYFGTYKLENNKLNLTIDGVTLMAGIKEDMQKEREYLDQLSKEYTVNLYKNILTLVSSDGKVLQFIEVKGEK